MSLYIKINQEIDKNTIENIQINTAQGNHSIPSCNLVMGDCPEYFIARDEMLECVNDTDYIYTDKAKEAINNNLEKLTDLFVPVVKDALYSAKEDVYYDRLSETIQEGTNLKREEISLD